MAKRAHPIVEDVSDHDSDIDGDDDDIMDVSVKHQVPKSVKKLMVRTSFANAGRYGSQTLQEVCDYFATGGTVVPLASLKAWRGMYSKDESCFDDKPSAAGAPKKLTEAQHNSLIGHLVHKARVPDNMRTQDIVDYVQKEFDIKINLDTARTYATDGGLSNLVGNVRKKGINCTSAAQKVDLYFDFFTRLNAADFFRLRPQNIHCGDFTTTAGSAQAVRTWAPTGGYECSCLWVVRLD